MAMIHPTSLLRYALLGDAIASGATGLLGLAGAGLLAEWLGLPANLLRSAGLILIPYAVLVAWLGTRRLVPRWSILAVVAINGLWALDSALLLASGWVAPTALGIGFVAFQAAAVAAFGLAQLCALRLPHPGEPLTA